jgi:hypothetical protein
MLTFLQAPSLWSGGSRYNDLGLGVGLGVGL